MDLDIFYRHYPAVEADVQAALDESLSPRGPDLLYDLVAALALPPGARALDVGCGDGSHTTRLAARFGFTVTGVDPANTEAAIAAAGLRVDQRIEPGSEWGEYAEEHSANAPGRKLLHAARLLRDPEHYVQRFGRATYDIALGDCLWHVYRMLGKLTPRVYVLSVA